MRQEERFVQSHRPYAVDLASLHTRGDGRATLGAVWFRRRRGLTAACVGYLRDHQNPLPTDAAEFLARHDDGRYGGVCEGRWDGERYWGSQVPDVIAQHLELLRPMLAGYPAIPAGHDGWYRF
jgi:hypothetical protein